MNVSNYRNKNLEDIDVDTILSSISSKGGKLLDTHYNLIEKPEYPWLKKIENFFRSLFNLPFYDTNVHHVFTKIEEDLESIVRSTSHREIQCFVAKIFKLSGLLFELKNRIEDTTRSKRYMEEKEKRIQAIEQQIEKSTEEITAICKNALAGIAPRVTLLIDALVERTHSSSLKEHGDEIKKMFEEK